MENKERFKLIQHLLTEVESSLRHSGRENTFIDSLREKFDRPNDLTERQLDSLKRFYDQID